MIRNVFLLLVLANLGVLAWTSWFDAAPQPGPLYDGPRITLLRELDPASLDARAAAAAAGGPGPSAAGGDAAPPPAAGQETAAAAVAAEPVADRCIAIGPFEAMADADAAASTLREAGFEPTLATEEREVRDGFWVFIEQIESLERAREIDAALAEAGLEDAYPITGSDRGVLISLGVFSDLARAATQADRVGRLGYEATIAESTRPEQTHWLDLRLSGEESRALDLVQEPGRISRFEERECEPDE